MGCINNSRRMACMKMKSVNTAVWFILSFCLSFNAFSESLYVTNSQELLSAVKKSHQQKLVKEIIIAPGLYSITKRLKLSRNNLTLRSETSDPESTVISGGASLEESAADVLIDISGSDITIAGVTLQHARRHLIQLRAETDSDNFTLVNSVLRDSYEQLLKVSAGNTSFYSDNGTVLNNTFYYSKGIGPQYYIGGIDAHRAVNWKVKYNLFKDIASPAEKVAEHAIHFWNNSANNNIVGNTIINCDRGIGFGMRDRENQNSGGLIADNLIVHDNPAHPFADVGIVLESSPYTRVSNNRVFLYGRYPNAIEYRFERTHSVELSGNKVNKKIRARNGGTALLKGNIKLVR